MKVMESMKVRTLQVGVAAHNCLYIYRLETAVCTPSGILSLPFDSPRLCSLTMPVPLYASIGCEYHIQLNYLIWLNIEKRSLMHATANSVEDFSK